jgi:hypothetical protein
MQHKKIILAVILMVPFFLSGWAGGSHMDDYLGSEYKGNYVWGGAMNLAWHELNENILHEELSLNTDDKVALEMVKKLNHSPFTRSDLDEKSYYIKSGFGQETLDLINKESRQKFPRKSFPDLKLKLAPTDIISYAYFLKEVEYWAQFKEKEVMFEKERVKGFYAKDYDQKKNIRILEYWDDDRFIISLKLKDGSDELFLAKGCGMNNPRGIVDEIDRYNSANLVGIGDDDPFEMPKLHLQHHRDYIELSRTYLANQGFETYFIASMFENINFDMDHKGARVENEAGVPLGAAMAQRPKIKRFILDKPFWVVMKRKNSQHPYFILGVKNTELMDKAR